MEEKFANWQEHFVIIATELAIHRRCSEPWSREGQVFVRPFEEAVSCTEVACMRPLVMISSGVFEVCSLGHAYCAEFRCSIWHLMSCPGGYWLANNMLLILCTYLNLCMPTC